MGTVTHSGRAANSASSANQALVIYRPLVEKVIAALGALVTHQAAYVLASVLTTAIGMTAVDTTDHGHLSMQWAIVTPLAVTAAVGFVLWQLNSLGYRSSLSVRSMGLMVAGFFVVQELIEGFVSGRSAIATMTHPAILIGIAVAPAVAWVMSRLLAEVTDLAARFVAKPAALIFSSPGPRLVPLPVRYQSTSLGGRSRPRAPPSRLRI